MARVRHIVEKDVGTEEKVYIWRTKTATNGNFYLYCNDAIVLIASDNECDIDSDILSRIGLKVNIHNIQYHNMETKNKP